MDGVVRITNYFEHPENSRYMVYSFFLEEKEEVGDEKIEENSNQNAETESNNLEVPSEN